MKITGYSTIVGGRCEVGVGGYSRLMVWGYGRNRRLNNCNNACRLSTASIKVANDFKELFYLMESANFVFNVLKSLKGREKHKISETSFKITEIY